MARVTLLRNSPLGRKGQTRDIEASTTRAAFALGLAEPYVEPPKVEAPKPKRVYRRKDMEAEQAPVVAIEPDPEPPPEDDDATVRLGD